MKGINKITLLGNLTKDPEIRTTAAGKVATFSLATNDSYKGKDGKYIDIVDYHNIVAWNHFADAIEKYVKKGDPIYLEGQSKTRSYEDKQGQKKYVTEVVVRDMRFLGGKQSGGTTAPAQINEPEETDSLPF